MCFKLNVWKKCRKEEDQITLHSILLKQNRRYYTHKKRKKQTNFHHTYNLSIWSQHDASQLLHASTETRFRRVISLHTHKKGTSYLFIISLVQIFILTFFFRSPYNPSVSEVISLFYGDKTKKFLVHVVSFE